MSLTGDTDSIINDSFFGDKKTAVIKSASFNHSSIPPVATSTVVETATVFIQPVGGKMTKNDKGQIIPSTHKMFVSDTSGVNVSHRIFISGTVSYFEVLQVKKYKGHFELDVKEVRGR